MAQVKPATFKLVTGHTKKPLWSFLIIYYITQKQSGKVIMFVEWYMKGFNHVYFLVIELIRFCLVGSLLREKVTFVLGEGHFFFLTSIIFGIWLSLFHVHQAHNLRIKWQRCYFYSICDFSLYGAFWKLCTKDHVVNWVPENLSTINPSGKQEHSAPSKTATGSLILSSKYYLKWWLKTSLKYPKTRLANCYEPSRRVCDIAGTQILSAILISTLHN